MLHISEKKFKYMSEVNPHFASTVDYGLVTPNLGLPEEASDEERDMLDLAFGLSETSRLGCQIILSKEQDGLEVKVPETINDARG
ncbi:Adrenodoxin, mitochondrial [Papilio machaon]|uniref:Adrenodoxin, mitochondrial n=1 Tax=Papilio machaon TaxID=76193 RepID=A0A0N1IAF2_PAPMA|nr:Adrenodoxin, mitochondrial [Papilio machaon]